MTGNEVNVRTGVLAKFQHLFLMLAIVAPAFFAYGSILATGARNPSAGNAERGIEMLHQQDISATLNGDPQALANLFSEEGVLLEPDSPAIVGRAAILADNQKQKAKNPGMRIISYRPTIKDLQVTGDVAYEWDYFEASFKESEKGEVKQFRAKALRVLKREKDGSWKFARVMWNLLDNQPDR